MEWFGFLCGSGPPGISFWGFHCLPLWVFMLAKGTSIHKSFLVPLFALQALQLSSHGSRGSIVFGQHSCHCLFAFSSSFLVLFSFRPSITAFVRDIQAKLKKNFGKENFEIKIQGQGPEECVEDVEKENSEGQMVECVEEEIGYGKLKSWAKYSSECM
nr:putative late blight resistance protein homolog R1A-10 [Ipomoea batatas]